jgi:hypothetical protein
VTFGTVDMILLSRSILGWFKYLRRVNITDLDFSGATSKETLIRISLRSLRARFRFLIAKLRCLFEVKITKSSA